MRLFLEKKDPFSVGRELRRHFYFLFLFGAGCQWENEGASIWNVSTFFFLSTSFEIDRWLIQMCLKYIYLGRVAERFGFVSIFRNFVVEFSSFSV